MTFDDLSKPQQRALIDIVTRNGLMLVDGGWDGTVMHRRATVAALAKRRLCRVTLSEDGTDGCVDPSIEGRLLVRAVRDDFNAALRGAAP